MEFITVWDIVLLPVYILIPYVIIRSRQKKMIEKDDSYKYYTKGLMAKIIGGIGVCLLYTVYYDGGGDTIAYIDGSVSMSKLLFSDTAAFFSILFNNLSPENYASFTNETGFPEYYLYRDPNSFSVIRFSSFFALFGCRSLFLTTILIAWATFPGMWKLYQLFSREFPDLQKASAIAILFMPSVFFWGSGLLKDSYTMSAACWLIYSVFSLISKREKIPKHLLIICISVYILIAIKPYIFYAIFFGILVVLSHHNIRKVRSAFLKFLIIPILLLFIWGAGLYAFAIFGKYAGETYSSVDHLLQKAVVNQQDLRREYYGENIFDIGTFDPTVSGVFSKFGPAMVAGLFRPYIWECTNPIMLISGLENLVLVLFSFYVVFLSLLALFRIGPSYMFKTLFDHPLIVFSFVFGFSFAFMVGLTTANFGALVRYKIPLIPFFMTSLIVIVYKYNRDRLELKGKIY